MNLFKKKQQQSAPTSRIYIHVYREIGVDATDHLWGFAIHLADEEANWIPCTTKAGAERVARTIARVIKKSGGAGELTVTNEKGQIAEKDTFGRDPRDIKG